MLHGWLCCKPQRLCDRAKGIHDDAPNLVRAWIRGKAVCVIQSSVCLTANPFQPMQAHPDKWPHSLQRSELLTMLWSSSSKPGAKASHRSRHRRCQMCTAPFVVTAAAMHSCGCQDKSRRPCAGSLLLTLPAFRLAAELTPVLQLSCILSTLGGYAMTAECALCRLTGANKGWPCLSAH